MLKVFFISVLIVTSRTPDKGWIQWTDTFATKSACQDGISKDYFKISEAVENYIGKDFKKVMEMRCLTYGDAANLNRELGH